ncbi:unnamed protein product [Leptosia nina]|uniref:Odorant receptor n=1 Tax=Leptosia nina TaxID=320188 RepID=A0AAV1J6Y2_9NEOP
MALCIKNIYSDFKGKLRGNRIENLIWLLNFVPKLVGFSLERETVFVPFLVLTITLLLYVYGAGIVMYQVKFAQTPKDYVKNYFNVSISIFAITNCYWWIKQRPLLLKVLKQVNENDRLSRKTPCLQSTQEKLLSVVKKILLLFYGFNIIDSIFIYVPHRVDVCNNYYSMTPCVGLEPITSTPNKQICLIVLALQEFCIITVVLNFQALLLFLIAHTSAMYQMLSAEILSLDSQIDYQVVKEKLPDIIGRHVLTLDITRNLQSLYSTPIGVNFGTNAVCIALFFSLSFQEWINFSPILIYCFLVFFLYCYLCQKLIDASEMFEQAVYACGWEKFQLKEKSVVYIMLLQAQKPVKLLAANIVPVNIYTFATTLQLVYKFITVVKL